MWVPVASVGCGSTTHDGMTLLELGAFVNIVNQRTAYCRTAELSNCRTGLDLSMAGRSCESTGE